MKRLFLLPAFVLAGCTLPPHIAETMVDEKLCSVHQLPSWHGFANDDHTRAVIDAERAARDQPACTETAS